VPSYAGPRVMHLSFHDIVREYVETIRQFHERAGLPYAEDIGPRTPPWLVDPENRSDRYDRSHYPYQP
jgi:hypothetical protein